MRFVLPLVSVFIDYTREIRSIQNYLKYAPQANKLTTKSPCSGCFNGVGISRHFCTVSSWAEADNASNCHVQ